MKKHVLVAAVAAVLAVPAWAATDKNGSQVYNLAVPPTDSFSAGFEHNDESGSFMDTVVFDLVASKQNGGGAFYIDVNTLGLGQNIDIGSIKLFGPLLGAAADGYGANVGTEIATEEVTPTGPNAEKAWVFGSLANPFNLTTGQYTLQLFGNVLGSNGGSYTAAVEVVPVPEPEEYLMMLGGLAAIAFVARRRGKLTMQRGFHTLT